jgi:hypothetical protein
VFVTLIPLFPASANSIMKLRILVGFLPVGGEWVFSVFYE